MDERKYAINISFTDRRKGSGRTESDGNERGGFWRGRSFRGGRSIGTDQSIGKYFLDEPILKEGTPTECMSTSTSRRYGNRRW